MKSIPYEITPCTQAEVELIDQKIDMFNAHNLHISTVENLQTYKNYAIKVDDQLIAGITCICYLKDCLYINVLFVDEKYRHQGIGTALLEKVETEAKLAGAKIAHLDTFDFQAKDFYLKHGYEIFGVLEPCPTGHKRYYMKKNL